MTEAAGCGTKRAMTTEHAERFKREDEFWNAPRFMALLGGTLFAAIALIYVMSSLYSDNWVWHPLAHDPRHELLPSD